MLSGHAVALADELAEEDHLAVTAIPTAAYAGEQGMGVGVWMAFRQEILTSVGAGIEELRRAGWTLRVEHRTDPEQHPTAANDW
jgi:hypothetical protein